VFTSRKLVNMERVLLKEDNYLEGKIASSTSSLPAVNTILRRASRKRPWKPEVSDNYCSRSVLLPISTVADSRVRIDHNHANTWC
jgi:hypothetical protein